MAGLLAARALSEHAQRIVVYEKDELPHEPSPRKSVPQGTHPHVLLAAGAHVLERWFPELFEQVSAAGGLHADMSAANNWFHFDTWKRRFDCGVGVHFQSRPLLEYEIRSQVERLPNVEFRRARVVGACWPDAGRPRLDFETGASMDLDLLIDASGRGSKLPTWLTENGYDPPRVEEVVVDVSYTSASFEPLTPRDWQGMLIYPSPPDGRRAGGALPIEGGRLLVSMFGWCGEHAELDDASFIEYAQSLPRPDIANAVRDSRRVSAFSSFKYRSARRLHYSRLRRFPAGTCVIGDALCSVDPVFGQGMTLAALCADLLERCARECGGLPGPTASRFQARALGVCETAWMLSTTEDFRYAEVRGQRPFGVGFSHWYTAHVHRLVGADDDVYRRFARVMHLLEPPTTLFHPSVVAKVVRASIRGAPATLDRPRAVDDVGLLGDEGHS